MRVRVESDIKPQVVLTHEQLISSKQNEFTLFSRNLDTMSDKDYKKLLKVRNRNTQQLPQRKPQTTPKQAA